MHEQIGEAPLGNVEVQHLPRNAMADNTDLKTIVSPSYQPIQRLSRAAVESTPL